MLTQLGDTHAYLRSTITWLLSEHPLVSGASSGFLEDSTVPGTPKRVKALILRRPVTVSVLTISKLWDSRFFAPPSQLHQFGKHPGPIFRAYVLWVHIQRIGPCTVVVCLRGFMYLGQNALC
jgi:hypothetical protein